MFGFSIDNRPDSPIGTKKTRQTVALHWHWTTEYTNAEIAAALGVTERTIEDYLDSTPGEEIEKQLNDVQTEVRYVAVQELKDQLRAAGHRSRTAEAPAKVWQGDGGDVHVTDVTDDDGEVVKRVPVPDDYDIMPDQKARYFAREEVRDILEQLTSLLGVGEPEEVKHTGQLDLSLSSGEKEQLDEIFDRKPDQ